MRLEQARTDTSGMLSIRPINTHTETQVSKPKMRENGVNVIERERERERGGSRDEKELTENM